MKIPTPTEMLADGSTDIDAEIDRVVSDLIGRLRNSKKTLATARGRCEVIEAVAQRMRDAEWCVLIEKGGARDSGATDGITVSKAPIPCPSCSACEPYDRPYKCAECGGARVVR